MHYLEDIFLGERIALGSHTFTAASIKTFARRFDPQVFHLDENAAARSHFGALCASGWHTVSVWMRLFVEHHRRANEALRVRGVPVAPAGPALGFRDLQWLKPVYAGDTIAFASEARERRLSASRPGWGVLTVHASAARQDGTPVLTFAVTGLLPTRAGAPTA